MKIIYRISDHDNKKRRPSFFTKIKCFMNFTKVFSGYDIYVVGDNISDETHDFLKQFVDSSKIFRTSLGNSGSFLYSVSFAIKHFEDKERVYFAEDDYMYLENAGAVIEEGLNFAEYSSGYDHPDKYINYSQGGDNPFIKNGGEETIVLLGKFRHWKYTNSCCMTFATTINVIKEDYNLYAFFCKEFIPQDFRMFCELYKRGRKVVSCIPGISTHVEYRNMSPHINWEQVMEESVGSEK